MRRKLAAQVVICQYYLCQGASHKKNAAYLWTSSIRGQSKSFGALFVHFFGRLFTLILVKFNTKSALKFPQKKISLQKSAPKVSKVWGGDQTLLEEVHN